LNPCNELGRVVKQRK
jgi:hypothetical protein